MAIGGGRLELLGHRTGTGGPNDRGFAIIPRHTSQQHSHPARIRNAREDQAGSNKAGKRNPRRVHKISKQRAG